MLGPAAALPCSNYPGETCLAKTQTLCREAMPFCLTSPFIFSSHSICSSIKQGLNELSPEPAAHVLESVTKLTGQKGKQGLGLSSPEAKLGTILYLFACSFILPRPQHLLQQLDFSFLLASSFGALRNFYSSPRLFLATDARTYCSERTGLTSPLLAALACSEPLNL